MVALQTLDLGILVRAQAPEFHATDSHPPPASCEVPVSRRLQTGAGLRADDETL
jgi:hypothetical protein